MASQNYIFHIYQDRMLLYLHWAEIYPHAATARIIPFYLPMRIAERIAVDETSSHRIASTCQYSSAVNRFLLFGPS